MRIMYGLSEIQTRCLVRPACTLVLLLTEISHLRLILFRSFKTSNKISFVGHQERSHCFNDIRIRYFLHLCSSARQPGKAYIFRLLYSFNMCLFYKQRLKIFLPPWCNGPPSGPRSSSLSRLHDHTQTHHTG